ncbi:hypothetical protein [Streptomyces sp900116325]|uniref:hypothetical protein n=1 Tax=Streptomyces sp. 900116325 TaxID=3154295 RepID=UPI00332C86E9
MSLADHMSFQSRRYRWFMSGRAINKLEDMRNIGQVEVLQAYMELRLVANPKPLEEADAVLSALDLLLGCTGRGDESQFDVAQVRVAEAQRRMVEACRDDLWYLPKWWHLWRKTWWSARWASLRGRKPLVVGGNSPGS